MEVNDRFSIESYLGKEASRSGPADGVNSHQFGQLVSKSQKALQGRLNDKELQEVFKNKSVSMMFLDKITRLLGQHHPDSSEASKFMFGPSFFPSMELIRHLSSIKSKVSPEAALHLEEWIESERECLPIAMIFDAWLLSNEDLVRQGSIKGGIVAAPTVTPPPEEVEAFANALAAEMKGMKPGDKFKMPAGSSGHVTRLQFIKNSDETFDVLHFNTGFDTNAAATAVKFVSIPAKTLEDPEFWKKLVEAKMQPEMSNLKSLLMGSCKNMLKPFGRVDDRLKKPMQENNSCSFHAAEAEFKHSFISSFPSIGEGWQAYKQCTSLMASLAVKQETSLEPAIERMLAAKENVRRRYLDWMTILDNPERFNAAKNAYMEAIASVGKYSQEENEMLIANQPPLMALKLLDKRLNACLNSVSYEQLTHIRETYGAAVTFDGFNHMGYKQLKWLEATREVLQDAAEFAGLKGTLLLKVRSLSSILLPDKWNSELQTKINFTVLDKASLTPLLTEYLLREDPEKGTQVLQALIKEKAVDDPFLYDEKVIEGHIQKVVKSDPQRVLELLSKSKQGGPLASQTCKDLFKSGHILEAFEVAKQLEGKDQQKAFARIALTLLKKGHKEQFLSLLELLGSFPSLLLVDVVEHYCRSNEFPDAIAMAHLISDQRVKQDAFALIARTYLERGNIDEAILNAKLAGARQTRILESIVDLLCKNNNIADAITVANMIPEEKELAFGTIARAFIGQGNIEEAIVYAKMAGGIAGSAILENIVTLHCRNNNIADAITVTNMIPEGKELAFGTIARAFIAQGNFEEAIRYANKTGRAQSRLLEDIIEKHCKSDRISDAIPVAHMMPDEYMKEQAFDTIAKAFLLKGNLEEAAANAAKAGGPRSQILRSIVEGYCKNKDTLNAIATANMIPIRAEKEATFAEIARTFIAQGNFEEAIANAKIAGPRFESRILKSIVEKHCENKDTANATIVANMISDEKEKAAAFQMIQKM